MLGKKHMSRGNVEMFPLLPRVQTETDHQYVTTWIASDLELLGEKLEGTFLPCEQLYVTGLEILLLISHQIHQTCSVCKSRKK